MDALGAYSSDEESDGPHKATTTSCALTKTGLEEAQSTDSSEQDEGGTDSEDMTGSKEIANTKDEVLIPAQKEPEMKKRKLINPFEAMSSVKPSFLKTTQVSKDEVAIEDQLPISHSISKSPSNPADKSSASSTKSLSKPADDFSADIRQEATIDSKKKQETVRQKNNRKEKLGQAKFTLKANRDCPDIWRGT
jgi:hypothetical protein